MSEPAPAKQVKGYLSGHGLFRAFLVSEHGGGRDHRLRLAASCCWLKIVTITRKPCTGRLCARSRPSHRPWLEADALAHQVRRRRHVHLAPRRQGRAHPHAGRSRSKRSPLPSEHKLDVTIDVSDAESLTTSMAIDRPGALGASFVVDAAAPLHPAAGHRAFRARRLRGSSLPNKSEADRDRHALRRAGRQPPGQPGLRGTRGPLAAIALPPPDWGASHCARAVAAPSPPHSLSLATIYNLGRLAAYAALGAIAGSLGRARTRRVLVGVQRVAAIVSGLVSSSPG